MSASISQSSKSYQKAVGVCFTSESEGGCGNGQGNHDLTEVRVGPVLWLTHSWTETATQTIRKRERGSEVKEVPNSQLLCNCSILQVYFFPAVLFPPSSPFLPHSCLLNLSHLDKLTWWFCLAEFSSGHEECNTKPKHTVLSLI